MNIAFPILKIRRTLLATAITAALLAGCATVPPAPEGAAAARLKLTMLQSDPTLADRAPSALHDAALAVQAAEVPEADTALAAHRVYLADRAVDTARAEAETRRAEDQRAALTAQRESARLNARTREADLAHRQADVARQQADVARADDAQQKLIANVATDQAVIAMAQSADQRQAADAARADAANSAATAAATTAAAATAAANASDAAAAAAAASARQAADLQQQIDLLQARPTDRGLVLTLGDVLFVSGHAELRSGAPEHLDKLVSFLNRYPQRSAVIEGYTDSVGSEDSNQALSQRRAEAVRSYLVAQGVASGRLEAVGKGESRPVADNATADGRQQNRRVEVVISNPAVAVL
jgi:outer membrane protein OmpA-like peptidoglycan-associated protein